MRFVLIGWRTLEPNSVTVKDAGPILRVRSNEALRPRSAIKGLGIVRRVNPAASVSSVNGVGAKNPCPAETRLVQPCQRNSAESRGLKNVPYWLWKSTRALADTESQRAISMSSCRNTPGVV